MSSFCIVPLNVKLLTIQKYKTKYNYSIRILRLFLWSKTLSLLVIFCSTFTNTPRVNKHFGTGVRLTVLFYPRNTTKRNIFCSNIKSMQMHSPSNMRANINKLDNIIFSLPTMTRSGCVEIKVAFELCNFLSKFMRHFVLFLVF